MKMDPFSRGRKRKGVQKQHIFHPSPLCPHSPPAKSLVILKHYLLNETYLTS
jgi:hypothetical protein